MDALAKGVGVRIPSAAQSPGTIPFRGSHEGGILHNSLNEGIRRFRLRSRINWLLDVAAKGETVARYAASRSEAAYLRSESEKYLEEAIALEVSLGE